jgi:hypothetical protein
VEWFVLTRCDAVLALTREGAESLRLLAGSAHALPHVVDGTAPWAKEPRVFVPGYVSDADTVVALVAEVARHAAASGVPWRVAVGSTDPHTQSEVEGRLGPSERAIVGFTGHLDEDRLLAEFDRAFVVVRAVGTDQHNAFAASGPLSWAASRGCLCLTNDARSGARELADEGLVLRSDSLASDLGALLAEWPDEPGVGLRFARAQSVLGIDAVAQRYGVVLAEAEQRHHVRASSPA